MWIKHTPLPMRKKLPVYLTSLAEAALPIHKDADPTVYIGSNLTDLDNRNSQRNNYSYAKPYTNDIKNYYNYTRYDRPYHQISRLPLISWQSPHQDSRLYEDRLHSFSRDNNSHSNSRQCRNSNNCDRYRNFNCDLNHDQNHNFNRDRNCDLNRDYDIIISQIMIEYVITG